MAMPAELPPSPEGLKPPAATPPIAVAGTLSQAAPVAAPVAVPPRRVLRAAVVPAPVIAPVVVLVAAVAFLLTPAAAVVRIIDYETRVECGVWSDGTDKLHDDLHDCMPDNLCMFLEWCIKHAMEMLWSDPSFGVLVTPEDAVDPATTCDNLLESYSIMPIERICRFETTHLNHQNESVQDNFMMYNMLMNSLSSEGQAKIMAHKKDFHIPSELGSKLGTPSGNLFVKVITRESNIENKCHISNLMNQAFQAG